MPIHDYQLDYLETTLSSAQPEAWAYWHAAFDVAYRGWQLDRAEQLLRLVKTQPLTQHQQGLVRFLTGRLRVRQDRWPEAIAAHEQALTIIRVTGEPHDTLLILTALANLLRRAGRPTTEVLALYQEALELITTSDDEDNRAYILNGIGLLHYNQGTFEQARSHYTQALASARANQNTPLTATLLHNLGSVAWSQGQIDEAAALFSESLQLQQDQADRYQQAETLNSLGLVAEARGDWIAATRLFEQSLEILQGANDLYGQIQALTNLGNVLWLMGDYQQSLSRHEQVCAIAHDLGDARLEGQALNGMGDSYRALNRFDQAEAAFQQAIVCKQSAGDERSLKHTYLSLGALYQVQQRPADAQAAYDSALALARQQQDTRMEATALLNLGQMALAQQQFERAGAYLEQAEHIALQESYWDSLAGVAQAQGDLEFLQPEPRMQNLLINYVMACAYAARFNQATLMELLNYLGRLWRAHAEDGYAEQAHLFWTSATIVWGQLEGSANYPEVTAFFKHLQAELEDQVTNEPTGR